MSKTELIKQRKQELINEFGYQSEEDIEEMLLNWFMQEFFIGEISRKELDEYAAEMSYSVNIEMGCDDFLTEKSYAQA